MTTKDKIIKARAALILDEPFFGSLVLRLTLKEDPSCKTMWTDGKILGYNPTFVESLSMDKLKGVLCHEVMHCALAHHTRRGDRVRKKWNVAADYVVNENIHDKFSLPDGVLLDSKYFGQTVDSIYPQLPDEQEDSQKDQSNEQDSKGGTSNGSASDSQSKDDDSKDENNDPGGCGEVRDATADDGKSVPSEADLAQAEAEWKVNVAQAAQTAKTFGKLPAGFDRVVDEIISSREDWHEHLKRFMDTIAKSDYSWLPPNRRHIHSGLYLPSCQNSEIGTIVIGIDTSLSIDKEMLKRVAGDLSAILSGLNVDCHVVYCDAKVQGVEEFRPGDSITQLDAKGGGGTNFTPVFEWIEEENITSSCVLYFTDLAGTFPDDEPTYPVLWIVEGKADREVPFGEVLEVEGK